MDTDIINSYLKKELWMDFEMAGSGIGEVRLHGYTDIAEEDKIIIKFKQVFMISAVTTFSYEGHGDFITVAQGETARNINMKFGVTKGHNVYILSNTDVGEDMFIIAKDVEAVFCNT